MKVALRIFVTFLFIISVSTIVYAGTGDQYTVGTIEVTQDVQEIQVSVPNQWQSYYNSHNGFGGYTWSKVSVNSAIRLNYTPYPTTAVRTITVTKSLLNGNDKLCCYFSYWLGGVTPYSTELVWNIKASSGSGGGGDNLIQEIAIMPESLNMLKGETYQLVTFIYPASGVNRNVLWTSSNTDIVKVDSEGLVTASNYGNATITCKTTDGSGKQAVCNVTVLPKDGVFSAKTSEGIDIKYRVLSEADMTCAVESVNKNVSGKVTIPGLVEGYNVTEIGNGAFTDCRSITSVSIPVSVKKIRGYAFLNCTSLTEVSGTNSIDYIGGSAFNGTPFLSSFPEGLVYIGNVLYCCKGDLPENTTVKVKEGTKCISNYALYSYNNGSYSVNDGVISVEIPASVTQIGTEGYRWYEEYGGFYSEGEGSDMAINPFYCHNLQSIVVDSNNEYYESPNNCNAIIEKNTKTLIAASNQTVIPSSVKIIGRGAFAGLGNIKSLDIPDNVEIVGEIKECRGIESVKIGKGVRKLFYITDCSGLRTIMVSPNNEYYDSRNDCNAIIEKATKKLIVGCNTTIIPSDVAEIKSGAFRGNCDTEIPVMVIPDNVETIGNGAFEDFGIKNIVIGRNIKEIKNYAFGSNYFRQGKYWWPITEIAVYCLSTTPALLESESVFTASIYNGTLYVPLGTKSRYSSANVWNKFVNIEEFDPSTFDPNVLGKVLVTEISLDTQSVKLLVGETKQLNVTIRPNDVTDNSVTWSSSNDDVATVNNSGLVVAKTVGTAIVTCKANDGSRKQATCNITVEELDLSPKSISLPVFITINIGGMEQLTPEIEPANAVTTLTWSTDDNSIAIVSQAGMVIGIKEGTAIITVKTDNGLSADCFVKVDPNASGICNIQTKESVMFPIFSVSGQRITAPRKGINIVGGKKVIVK